MSNETWITHLIKYTGLLSDKVLNLSKKELKALEDSAQNYRDKTGFKLFQNDDVNSLSTRFKLELNDKLKNVIISKTNNNISQFLILFCIKRFLTTGKLPVKIDKLNIGEIDTMLKTFQENITTVD